MKTALLQDFCVLKKLFTRFTMKLLIFELVLFLNFEVITFDYRDDADDAIYYLDGVSLFGRALEVQLAQGDRKSKLGKKVMSSVEYNVFKNLVSFCTRFFFQNFNFILSILSVEI